MLSRVQARLFASGVLSLVLTVSAGAQCAMCKATLAGDPHAAAAAHQMNMAVLLLLIPAVVIFTGFFVVMYRYRDSFRNSPPDSSLRSAGVDEFDPGKLPAFRPSAGPEWL